MKHVPEVSYRAHRWISGRTTGSVVATCVLALALSTPAWATSAENSYWSSRHPAYVAPPSEAPSSCSAAHKALDGNGDGRLDEHLMESGQAPGTQFAERCIKDNGGAWGYYLLARTLAVQHKFIPAAIAAEAAQHAPPVDGFISPKAADISLFRANALADGGDWTAADKIYDELIKKICAAQSPANEGPTPR